jgi:FMN phosphatase YigB (HAD superfamily)
LNKNKPQLVLDIAGVLISNLSPSLWEELALYTDVSPTTLKNRFKQDIRKDLWSGQLPEPAFWLWLQQHYPSLEISAAKSLLSKKLYPLPATKLLHSWSQIADIHLLSNHRLEWLDELLVPIKPFVKSITISSGVGFSKPDPQIYHHVQQIIQNSSKVLFVDDQERNLLPAASLGWSTLIADSQGKWTELVIPILLT